MKYLSFDENLSKYATSRIYLSKWKLIFRKECNWYIYFDYIFFVPFIKLHPLSLFVEALNTR